MSWNHKSCTLHSRNFLVQKLYTCLTLTTLTVGCLLSFITKHCRPFALPHKQIDTQFPLETFLFAICPTSWLRGTLVSSLSDSETSLPGLSFSVWLWDTLSKSWNEWSQDITLCPPIRQLASNSNAPQACDTIAGCLWSYKHTTQSHCMHFSSECSVHQTGTEEQLWLYMIWWHIVWMCVWMWVHDAFSRPSRFWCRKFSTYSYHLNYECNLTIYDIECEDNLP